MSKFIDLTGQQFNSWKILRYAGNRYWTCLCLDCKKITKNVHVSSLKQGTSKSCGCKNRNPIKDDISGNMFGNWKVLYHIGDGYWMCECQCENKTKKPVKRCNLINEKTKSCGCLKRQLTKDTLLERYGETVSTKIYNPREAWQIEVLEDADKLKEFIINSYESKPTFLQLSKAIGVTRHCISTKIHQYKLESYVDIDPLSSEGERELGEYIKEICSCEIRTNVRDVIYPFELDIHIPYKNIAIEFNGNYWHSDINVCRNYHKDKTLRCAKKDIRLIHIFEYEWENNKDKIKNYIRDVLSDNLETIYARKCGVRILTDDEAKEFLDRYHLQGYSHAGINIGLHDGNEILGIMTFGTPRFNNNFEYELIRLCFKSGYSIVGGAERMFKFFINRYNPTSIVTYTNLAKFTGNIYTKLGFKSDGVNSITEPNYIWYDTSSRSVIQGYKVQKHKLIAAGLGNEGQTEDEIMKELDFLKIYDSGNLRLEWSVIDNDHI